MLTLELSCLFSVRNTEFCSVISIRFLNFVVLYSVLILFTSSTAVIYCLVQRLLLRVLGINQNILERISLNIYIYILYVLIRRKIAEILVTDSSILRCPGSWIRDKFP